MSVRRRKSSQTRVRRVGPWKGRAYRFVAAMKSAAAWARLWRRLSWRDRMWLLWAAESTPPEAEHAFAREAGRALRRAWVKAMVSTPDAAPKVADPPDPAS
jgi:hypothetical protein